MIEAGHHLCMFLLSINGERDGLSARWENGENSYIWPQSNSMKGTPRVSFQVYLGEFIKAGIYLGQDLRQSFWVIQLCCFNWLVGWCATISSSYRVETTAMQLVRTSVVLI